MSKDITLSAKNLSKSIEGTSILRDISLDLHAGEAVALVGPSGVGKTTLLHLLGLLDEPTTGSIYIFGKDTQGLSEKERTELRRDSMGFVYQFHHLLPNFSALENVALPLLIQGKSRKAAYAEAEKILKEVGLEHRLAHRSHQLSGGEQQRVAIARAIVHKPKILLADEPTGNLDSKNSQHIFDMLVGIVKKRKIAALVATHNEVLARQLDRIVTL